MIAIEDRDRTHWARLLEAGRQDEPTLELASQLDKYEPDVPLPGHFEAELRARLLAQSERLASSRPRYAVSYAGRLAIVWVWGLAALGAGVLLERRRLQC